jgi:DNA-binding transcriptional regulator YbjK
MRRNINPPGRLIVVEQDIAGFEVAVNNAPAMDVCYRLHQRGEELSHLRRRQETGLQALGQRTARDVRRHQEESTIDLAKFKLGQNMVVCKV